eukprot:6425470-Prymnesium_polylepis.1
MLHRCRGSSESVRRAAAAHPSWRVAARAGQGVFAIEECLEVLLARARREKEEAAAGGEAAEVADADVAARVEAVLPLRLSTPRSAKEAAAVEEASG